MSTWLGAGVPAAEIAEWAGHSVAGQEDAKRRITDATRPKDLWKFGTYSARAAVEHRG